ncbi:MAG: hypothetical protein E7211_13460 [Clostridium lundense]|nr:hypothetical protein [Clostridium lundense]
MNNNRNNSIYSQIFNNSKEYDVYSFDIFDTLLFRTVIDPTDVFEKVLDKLNENANYKISFNKNEFKLIRILAENKARTKKKRIKYNSNDFDNEVTLDDIYNEINIDKDLKKVIMNAEIEMEKEITYINPVINKIIYKLRENNKKVILTSEMYLTKSQIQEILKHHGFPVNKVDMYISSDLKYTKSSGKLFKYIIKDLNIEKDKIIHIGDNEISDIDGARKCGIKAIKYDVISNKDYIFDLEKFKFGKILPEIESLRCLYSSYSNEKYDFWFKLGFNILGPFLTYFSQWVIDLAKKSNILQIRPLMREGVILTETIKQASQYNKTDLDIKPLFLSRESTVLPGLDKISDDFIDKLFERRFSTVEDLLKNLKIFYYLKDSEINDILNKNVLELNTKEKNIIKNLIKKYENHINEEIVKESEKFYRYLDQEIDLNNKFLTVDLGYRGTIQSNINNLLKKYKKNSLDMHALAIGGEYLVNHLIEGINVKSYINEFDINHKDKIKAIMWEAGIVEELMNDERGSTVAYKFINGNMVPVLQDNLIPYEEYSYKRNCQKGVLKFQKLFYEHLWENIKDLNVRENKIESILPVIRMLEVPTLEEVNNLINLHHDENLGTYHVSTFISKKDKDLISKYGVERFLNLAYAEKALWPQGVVTLYDSNFIINKTIREAKIRPKYYNEAMVIMNKLSKESINTVIIYGAGEVAKGLIKFMLTNNIKIKCIVDRKETLWGSRIQGIEIVPFDSINEDDLIDTVFVIASISFVEEINCTIINKFGKVKIISIK